MNRLTQFAALAIAASFLPLAGCYERVHEDHYVHEDYHDRPVIVHEERPREIHERVIERHDDHPDIRVDVHP